MGGDKKLLRDLLDHRQERSLLILETAADGTVRAVNELARQMLGDDLEGKRLKEIFLDFRGAMDLTKLVAKGSQPCLVNVATASGLPATLYFRFYPVADRIIAIGELNWLEVEKLRRELVRANNELHNLTRELHQRNAELLRLNEFKDHFLGMVAHDLRNPLTAIMGFCQFMISKDKPLQWPEAVDLLREICEQSNFMLALINDLLDLAIIEMGKPHIKLAPANFSVLLRKTVKVHRLLAREKGIELRLKDRLPLGEVVFDAAKISQVLNNLLSNAVKFSGTGTQVTITAAIEHGEMIVAVRDHGPGIAPDEMPRLFTPFPGISTLATDGEKATGLGLTIAKGIIVAHEGRIWAESKPGKGSTFFFSLPLRRP